MTRVHTWRKNFGHKLPKPSVLMLTLIPDLVTPLQGKWSRKMEDAWSRMLTRDLMKMIPIWHLWKNRNKFPRYVQNNFILIVFWGCVLSVSSLCICALICRSQTKVDENSTEVPGILQAQGVQEGVLHQNIFEIQAKSSSHWGKTIGWNWSLYASILPSCDWRMGARTRTWVGVIHQTPRWRLQINLGPLLQESSYARRSMVGFSYFFFKGPLNTQTLVSAIVFFSARPFWGCQSGGWHRPNYEHLSWDNQCPLETCARTERHPRKKTGHCIKS